MKINPGTRIKWKAAVAHRINASTFSDEHEGIYMGYCEPHQKPETVCPELKTASSSSKKFGSSCGTSSLNRVIVKVPRLSATTGEAIEPYWYGPRVSSITHAYLEGQWFEIVPKQCEWVNASSDN